MKCTLVALSCFLLVGSSSSWGQGGANPGQGANPGGSNTAWYQQGGTRVEVVTDADGNLTRMVVAAAKYETDDDGNPVLMGYEFVTLTPSRIRSVSQGAIMLVVNAILANPSLVISPATVAPPPGTAPPAAAILTPLGLHISRREVGARTDPTGDFSVTTTTYNATGGVTGTTTTTSTAPPSQPPAAGPGPGGGRRQFRWVPVQTPVYASGSF